MGLYEDRVKRLHDHVMAAQKKEEKPAELTNAEIMKMLDELGVEYDKKANKSTLKALLEAAQKEKDGSEGAE